MVDIIKRWGIPYLTTEFRVVSDDGTEIHSARLIAAPSLGLTPVMWSILKQGNSFTEEDFGSAWEGSAGGGSNAKDPFNAFQRLRDYFGGYANYTRTQEEAIRILYEFEETHPVICTESDNATIRKTSIPVPQVVLHNAIFALK